jgi:hypothetical protein
VEEDGALTGIKVVKGVATPLDEEAMRVAGLMPKWKPGTLNGKPVRVRYYLPIRFYPN